MDGQSLPIREARGRRETLLLLYEQDCGFPKSITKHLHQLPMGDPVASPLDCRALCRRVLQALVLREKNTVAAFCRTAWHRIWAASFMRKSCFAFSPSLPSFRMAGGAGRTLIKVFLSVRSSRGPRVALGNASADAGLRHGGDQSLFLVAFAGACRKAHALHEGFGIATYQSRKLRQQAKGKVETFLRTMLNHAVAERLDLRDGGLSAELNSLVSNAGRAILEGKLHDIFEKFGADIYRVEAAYTSQECAECGHIHAGNRKGETFKCRACGHAAHADENAAATIEKRRSLPGTCRLTKTGKGFSWQHQGSLPRIALEQYLLLKQSGIRFPNVWAALRSRPKLDHPASAAAGSSAADGGVKSSSPSKKGTAFVSEAFWAGRLPTPCPKRYGT